MNGSFYGCDIFNPRHWSGSQIKISIRITPNFELVLAMVIASLLTKFHQNPTSTLWETLIRISDFQNPTFSFWETSIRITPNFELGLPMIITSLLIKIHRNPTSSLWEILLTNKENKQQTNRKTNKPTQEGDCNIPFFAGWKSILSFIGWSLRNWKIAAFLQLAKNWNTPNNLWQFFFLFQHSQPFTM